jgi:hypothetical protein
MGTFFTLFRSLLPPWPETAARRHALKFYMVRSKRHVRLPSAQRVVQR